VELDLPAAQLVQDPASAADHFPAAHTPHDPDSAAALFPAGRVWVPRR
jgi:hypothetical protein